MMGMRTTVSITCLLVSLIPVMAQSRPSAAVEFYVANHGNDQWSGRLAEPTAEKDDGPFRTLERARDELRSLKQSPSTPVHRATVTVREGTYVFNQSFKLDNRDSGAPGAPVRYRAYPGEQVILSGGPTVASEAFQPLADTKLLERLYPSTRAHVVWADLHSLGIKDLGEVPVKYQGAPAIPELFINNRGMTLARWPNEHWTTISKIIDAGACPRIGDRRTHGGVFEYSGDRPAQWNVDAGVWLRGYWCYDWYAEVIRVKGIDPQKRQISLAAPSVYSVKQGNPSPRRYYALNLLEELDRPGEYYIDRQAGRLYVWPPVPLADARIVLSTLNSPIVMIKEASDVIVRGFTVEACLGNGIEVSAGNRVCIQACEVRNLREVGITVAGGTKHSIEACDIHDTGAGGIVMAGGERKTLTPAGHQALNNHIWRFSRLKLTYSNALVLKGVGNRGAHNLIHDAPHQAIGINGNEHVFEYNIVHHVCMATDDCGAWYKGRNPSCRGNNIRYNLWHDIGSPMGHGNSAIYFDDGDGGDIVFGNIFLRCGEPGRGSFGTVFSHGGHDNLAENNIFIECKRALGSAPWNDARWKRTIAGGEDCFWQDKLLKQVDISKPPYTTRYPALIGFMDPQPGQTRVNRALRNVFVRCNEISNGNWQVPASENWITEHDPGFVNASKGDFRLKPNAGVYAELPGFQTIPFEKIGLMQNALRPTTQMDTGPSAPRRP
jgi:hypothetical protein